MTNITLWALAAFCVVATIADTVQSVVLASVIFNWSVSRKEHGVSSMITDVNQPKLFHMQKEKVYKKRLGFYRTSVYISIMNAFIDWAAIAIELYLIFVISAKGTFISDSETHQLEKVSFQYFAICTLSLHSFGLVYNFQLLKNMILREEMLITSVVELEANPKLLNAAHSPIVLRRRSVGQSTIPIQSPVFLNPKNNDTNDTVLVG